MTTLGKTLVVFNLLIGMAFLTWSVGLYTQKIHWIDHQTPEGEKIEGEIAKLKVEIDRYAGEARLSSKRWGDAHETLRDNEKTREERQKAFAARLEAARTNPTQGFHSDLIIPGTALINTEQLGPPLKGPDGANLRGSETLLQTVNANIQATDMYLKQVATLKAQQKTLQENEKVLQEKVDKHAVIYDELLNEQRYLAAFEINWFEQLTTVQRRKVQLVARLAEFK